MNLRTRVDEEPEVNLTSLIDVVLLLLIFFMVSTSFVREAELNIQLPEASAEPMTGAERAPLEIAISAEGGYFVNDRALVNNRPETLRRALETTAGETRDVPITIRADARATHQAVITAMDTAARLGFVQVNLATVNTQEGE